ncbi:MAG: hypothetical protein OJF62_000393 [Pseudolabrys sp.]|jgi:hypothetical protein|nr:hypothetical protein [Pseudolabrys sp.]
MLPRDRALWALAIVLCLVLLMAPALWNGFPLLEYDTGGYLARWYEGYLVPSRAVAYGLLLNAGSGLNFWPVILLQSALTVWVVHLLLRAHGYGRPLVLVSVIAPMSVATTLPWLTAILLTDIFCGLSVIALYLIVLRPQHLASTERIGLVALIAFGVATHSATFAVVGGLMICAVIARLAIRRTIPLAALGSGAAAVALGALLVFAADFAVSGQWAWTPGGFALSFGRMLQDGIVTRYLDEHCPDPQLRLCAHRAELPLDADRFFWASDVFDKLGRFAGLGKEMETIALRSVAAYPWMQVKSAAADTAEQIVAVHTGEGVIAPLWHTQGIMKRYTPWVVPQMSAARQQRGALSFTAINRLHYPLALLALAALPLIVLLRRKAFADNRDLAVVVLLAVLGNAAVCGIVADPHDRYGARIVWLASLTVAMVILHATRPPKFD